MEKFSEITFNIRGELKTVIVHRMSRKTTKYDVNEFNELVIKVAHDVTDEEIISHFDWIRLDEMIEFEKEMKEKSFIDMKARTVRIFGIEYDIIVDVKEEVHSYKIDHKNKVFYVSLINDSTNLIYKEVKRFATEFFTNYIGSRHFYWTRKINADPFKYEVKDNKSENTIINKDDMYVTYSSLLIKKSKKFIETYVLAVIARTIYKNKTNVKQVIAEHFPKKKNINIGNIRDVNKRTDEVQFYHNSKLYYVPVKRSKRKNLVLAKNDRELTIIKAPKDMDDDTIRRYVKLENIIPKISEEPSWSNYNNNVTLKLFGENYKLRVTKSDKPHSFYFDDKDKTMNLQLTEEFDWLVRQEALRFAMSMFDSWIFVAQQSARKLMNERGFDIPPHSVETSRQETTWGKNYVEKKIIRYNYDILHTSKAAITTTIVHELVHNIHPNHNKDFWEIVHLFIDDRVYKKLKAEMQFDKVYAWVVKK